MLDFDAVIKNLGFTETDVKNISNIHPIAKELFEPVSKEVLNSFGDDARVKKIMESGGISEEEARKVWTEGLNYIFTITTNKDFLNTIKKIGRVHVIKGVEEDLVIEATTLFAIKIAEKLLISDKVSMEQIISLMKGFGVVLTLLISSYRDEMNEQEQAVLNFMGISPELLRRQIEIGRKNLRD